MSAPLVRTAVSGSLERASRRLVTLRDFEEAVALSAEERPAFRRRFVTLFADDSRTRRGGLGRVTYAENALGEAVAMKTLIAPEREPDEPLEDFSRRDATAREAFRQEYECHRALSGLRGFPRLYGWGLMDGSPTIVMEWVEGKTLAQAAAELAVDGQGRLSPLVVARLGRDLFELLARMALVGEGYVHRDVSPSNVMLRTSQLSVARQVEEGSFDLCLIDFGSASAVPGPRESFTVRSRAVRGATPDYAAPEMLTQDLPDLDALRKSPSIDVFAAASVLAELLGARLPFPTHGEKDQPGGTASPFRAKMDHAPERPVTAHGEGSDLASVLALEPEVAVVAGRAASDLGCQPSQEDVRRALALVDGQLCDMLMACLDVAQERRPTAVAMRDGLASFCANYAENVRRALLWEPLASCTDTASWIPFVGHGRAWRAARVTGRLAASVVWVAVIGSAAVLADKTPAALSLPGLSWEGMLASWAVAATLALPLVPALVARGRDAWKVQGLVRATLGLLAGALAVAGAVALLSLAPAERAQGLLAALFAASAAVWFSLVLDYVTLRAPGLLRERRRLLPKAAPSGTAGQLGSDKGTNLPSGGGR